MKELWENFTGALDNIKQFVFGFIDLSTSVFSMIPSPFKEILLVAILIIVALVVLKIVRG